MKNECFYHVKKGDFPLHNKIVVSKIEKLNSEPVEVGVITFDNLEDAKEYKRKYHGSKLVKRPPRGLEVIELWI